MGHNSRLGASRRDVLKTAAGAGGALALAALPRRVFAAGTQPTELVFASAPFFSDQSITALLEAYNGEQSAVRARYLKLPSAADPLALHADLRQRLRAGKGAPDVFSLDIVRVAEFSAAGLSLPLGGNFDATEMQAYFKGVLDGCTVDGALMAMPWFIDCGMLFYRTDILEKLRAKVPETWPELVATARRGKSRHVPHGFLWQGKSSEALVCNIVSVVGSNGGTLLSADGKTVGLATPEAAQAVEFLRDTIHRTKISPLKLLEWDEEPSRQPFNAGEAVFLRNWSYTWGLAQQAGSPIAGKIGVAPLPHFPGKRSAACLGGFQYGVNAASPNKEAALDLLRWLTSPATQLQFAARDGLAPTRAAVFDNPTLARTQPFLAQLKPVFVGALARPVTPKYPAVTLAIQAGVSAALKGGGVGAALSAAQKRIEAILAA